MALGKSNVRATLVYCVSGYEELTVFYEDIMLCLKSQAVGYINSKSLH